MTESTATVLALLTFLAALHVAHFSGATPISWRTHAPAEGCK